VFVDDTAWVALATAQVPQKVITDGAAAAR
jgi:hypothetical protein